MANSEQRNITIFDTTLRDGEQSPGCSMNLDEKLEVAQALVDLGVDVIEAGFPISSPGDFEAVSAIASTFRGATICGLARSAPADIDRAWDALKTTPSPRIHVFLATSAIHRQFKLKMSPEQVIERAVEGVRHARSYCDDIEFSPEDAARTEIDFLCQVVEAVIDAGATTVNIPDTVGYAVPAQVHRVIATLVNRVPNIDKAVLSVHCHNDLGLAVANSLAAVEAGAGQIECTINGIGERAGNCALEEVVMAMRTRGDFYPFTTHIRSHRLVPASRLVSSVTGMKVQRNKAIVGQNAFAHEAGIHQDGVLKERTTYEIMRPEDVGFAKTDLVLGKHSGRAALADRAKQLGYVLTGEQLQSVFEDFKKLADMRKEVTDGDIAALIEHQLHGVVEEEWKLVDCQLIAKYKHRPEFSITLKHNGQEYSAVVNDAPGPIDAAFIAVEQITGIKLNNKSMHIQSASEGDNAPMNATFEADVNGKIYRGRGVSTNSVYAAMMAILNALNRVALNQKYAKQTQVRKAGA